MNIIKTFLKSIGVAFSIYSKIPMPSFRWDDQDMKYHLTCFPLVGLVLGLVELFMYFLCAKFDINPVVFGFFFVALIIFVTGGLHMDGFMDTCDAIHSYQGRERKLEILKDPHIGAFAVICFAGMILIQIATASEIMALRNLKSFVCMCVFFGASRAASGLMVLNINPAKSDGMLKAEADNSDKKAVSVVLIIEILILAILMVLISPLVGAGIIVMHLTLSVWFVHMCKKDFGGITGDLAGYFLCISEVWAMVVAMIISVVA